jgi:PelA/Pel-15E family pectate lyase
MTAFYPLNKNVNDMRSIRIKFLLFLGFAVCQFSGYVRAQDRQADNMLLFQRNNGGWFKQFHGKAFSYNVVFSNEDSVAIAAEVKEGATTIDNDATNKEIRYLVNIYKAVPNPRYLAAAEKGIRYLLKAQYANGGFPQYYPDRGLYRNEITYNDNAMINTMNVLRDVALKQHGFEIVDKNLIPACELALKNGIGCILKTQIKVDGKLTAWCQQYNEKTLEPAKARAYELPSISGSESVGIIEFLMTEPTQTNEIKEAIIAGVNWLNSVKISGYKFLSVPDPNFPEGNDRKLIPDANSTAWARFYEIGTNRPFFCDRDGIKKYDVKEIGYERRNGYGWYGAWPQQLITVDYPAWLKSNKLN